ncbi:hypothetical protein [Arthrobacter sp. NPDC057009]|uniref:hypothetical protein n=1 Tax=Arthrobacter sp. NPDC057009 TaxID=3345996 RepID=UPI0036315A56
MTSTQEGTESKSADSRGWLRNMHRVVRALLSNGIFSAVSLALSVMVARSGGTGELGMFGVAFAAYLLVQLVVRDAGANTIISVSPSYRKRRTTARRISFMAIVFAIPISLCGVFAGSPYLVIVGLAIHGICFYDYSKTLSLSLDDGQTAIMQDCILLLVTGCAVVMTWFDLISPFILVAIWASAGSALGYLVSYIQGYKLLPSWKGEAVELRTSLIFGCQALIGSGSVHILTFLLSLVGGPVLVGAMRGASTMLGPSNLIVSTVQPLLISYLARSTPDPATVSRAAVRKSALALVCVHLVLTSGLVLISHFFGELLLGSTWQDSSSLIYIVALDSVFVAVAAAPLAAHRSVWAAKRVAAISNVIVVIRIPLVLVCALWWHAIGAVAAFLCVTIIASLLWWMSLIQLTRK